MIVNNNPNNLLFPQLKTIIISIIPKIFEYWIFQRYRDDISLSKTLSTKGSEEN